MTDQHEKARAALMAEAERIIPTLGDSGDADTCVVLMDAVDPLNISDAGGWASHILDQWEDETPEERRESLRRLASVVIDCVLGDLPEHMTSAQIIAARFIAFLRAELSVEEWFEMQRKNATPEYAGPICASHDYVDANVIMAAAFESVTGRESECDSDAAAALWSEAWEIAKRMMQTGPASFVEMNAEEYDFEFGTDLAESYVQEGDTLFVNCDGLFYVLRKDGIYTTLIERSEPEAASAAEIVAILMEYAADDQD